MLGFLAHQQDRKFRFYDISSTWLVTRYSVSVILVLDGDDRIMVETEEDDGNRVGRRNEVK